MIWWLDTLTNMRRSRMSDATRGWPSRWRPNLSSLQAYLAAHSEEIGTRILFSYPALFGTDEAPSPLLSRMLRSPYPAQTLAIMGVSRRWQLARNANVVAECAAGKTLIALGSMLVHGAGRPFTGLVMAPPHLVEKWARETFLTLPHVRVFLIDDMRNGGNPREPHGINEVRLRRGNIVREEMHTSLTELRRLGRKGWRRLCPESAIFCICREKAKLSYFWKHCYGRSRSGRYLGALTNPDTGSPIETDGVRLNPIDFDKKRLHEIVELPKEGTAKYCPLWQADGSKIVRMAPAEYMGRYMPEWFDYAITDEIHQLAGDTAQGNALGVLHRTARRFLGLTGTLLSGYADDLFNTLFLPCDHQEQVRGRQYPRYPRSSHRVQPQRVGPAIRRPKTVQNPESQFDSCSYRRSRTPEVR
jgi:hypothetical protein